jgi:hypothetical protein
MSESYFFPTFGLSFEAESLEDAQKQLKKFLNKNPQILNEPVEEIKETESMETNTTLEDTITPATSEDTTTINNNNNQ